MKPFNFNPQPSRLAALFAEWVPMYIGQATMDDDEAEPFQQPLCDLEKAIDDHPITTLQDFFVKHTVVTCFGSMAADYSLEQLNVIRAAAMAELRERESLLALISEHIDNEAKFEEAGGDELSSRGIDLMLAIAAHPATSFATVMLKGRYFAARHARGDLAHSEAFAFAASFSDNAEGRVMDRHLFSKAAASGVSAVKEIEVAAAHLEHLMRSVHGGHWSIDIDHDTCFVAVSRDFRNGSTVQNPEGV